MYGIAFLESDIFVWIVIPLLIFIARVIDVTFGTIRIIFVSKGKNTLLDPAKKSGELSRRIT
jgi:uncharacterized protein YebE (UPF0316 family)